MAVKFIYIQSLNNNLLVNTLTILKYKTYVYAYTILLPHLKLFNIAADVSMLLVETHIKTSPLRPTLQ